MTKSKVLVTESQPPVVGFSAKLGQKMCVNNLVEFCGCHAVFCLEGTSEGVGSSISARETNLFDCEFGLFVEE